MPDAESALAGARDIIAEAISDDAALRKVLRGLLMRDGVLTAWQPPRRRTAYTACITPTPSACRAWADQPGVLASNRGEKKAFECIPHRAR